jgi:chromosome segregation ATPase
MLDLIVTGLPPARQALARHVREVEEVTKQIVTLKTGAARLEADIGKVASARRELDELAAADARNLFARLKGDVAWALGQFGGAREIALDERLSASRHQVAVAERALSATNDEIVRLEQDLENLRARKAGYVAGALRESAAGIFSDYEIAAANLREGMVQLAALERHLGVSRFGRIIGERSFIRLG